tara:strand:+ start:520 stop:933 length:414 start_codon:yes stop_codon:yes gene_type:complete
MSDKNKIKRGSNRSFGLVFFVIFFIIAIWPMIDNSAVKSFDLIRKIPFSFSLFFLILGLMNSKVLTPLNVLWFKFGMLLGSIVAPIVMAAIFFFVVTPTGFIMRIFGKDVLGKRIEKNKNSYWIRREKSLNSMKRQF